MQDRSLHRYPALHGIDDRIQACIWPRSAFPSPATRASTSTTSTATSSAYFPPISSLRSSPSTTSTSSSLSSPMPPPASSCSVASSTAHPDQPLLPPHPPYPLCSTSTSPCAKCHTFFHLKPLVTLTFNLLLAPSRPIPPSPSTPPPLDTATPQTKIHAQLPSPGPDSSSLTSPPPLLSNLLYSTPSLQSTSHDPSIPVRSNKRFARLRCHSGLLVFSSRRSI